MKPQPKLAQLVYRVYCMHGTGQVDYKLYLDSWVLIQA